VGQADLCADACIKLDPNEMKTIPSENETLFSKSEATCIDNCANKVFGSDKVLRAYLPLRLKQAGGLSMKEIEKRMNNPTDEYGPYFLPMGQ
jgi:hypothetical protein